MGLGTRYPAPEIGGIIFPMPRMRGDCLVRCRIDSKQRAVEVFMETNHLLSRRHSFALPSCNGLSWIVEPLICDQDAADVAYDSGSPSVEIFRILVEVVDCGSSCIALLPLETIHDHDPSDRSCTSLNWAEPAPFVRSQMERFAVQRGARSANAACVHVRD